MYQESFILKSVKYTPLLLSRRWKVRILPKEHHDGIEFSKPRPRPFVNAFAFLHKRHSWDNFCNWMKWRKFNQLRDTQRYIPERHQILGPDLAAAHFITARGGQIKFLGQDVWMSLDDLKNNKIPSVFTPGYYVEEIDVTDIYLFYEAYQNLCNLRRLKKLIMKNSPSLDDWCMSRFYLFANTLEYLDISGCQLVTERGICTLHVLKKLKTLLINDTPNVQNKELVSLLLQDIIPQCDIIGVNYDDPVLLKRLGSYMN